MVTLALITAGLCAISSIVSGLIVHFVNHYEHEKETARLMYAFERAMLLSHPGAQIEKAQAETTKQAADLQLVMLEDALAMERDKKQKEQDKWKPTPRLAMGIDATGNEVEVDMNDYVIQD